MSEVVIDVGRRSSRQVLVGGVVSGALGAAAVGDAIRQFVVGEPTVVALGVAVVGSLFLGVAMLMVLGWRVASRPRSLVFDAAGVRWDDPTGSAWAVPWSELGGVRISRQQDPVTEVAEIVVPQPTRVRLELVPADPRGFRARHPGIAPLARDDGGYRLPLGHMPDVVPTIEGAVVRFAPRLYRGVHDDTPGAGLT